MAVKFDNVVDITQRFKQSFADMDTQQFQQWSQLLEQRTGITLPESRRSFLVTSLNIRMRELGFEGYDSYFDYLQSGREGKIEWETLVDRLTVHETRFFRDQKAIDLIRNVFFKQAGKGNDKKTVHVWSVGCATGEEAYSLAIDLNDYVSTSSRSLFFSVTGSDISSAAISTARKGVYPLNRLTNVNEYFLCHYFDKQDERFYRVKDFLQQRVCFSPVNLLELDKAKTGMMDIIFCQNVLIYFKREQRIKILNGLVEHLNPNGLLVLGAGEIHGWANPEMEPVDYEGTLAFRRIMKQESEL